MTIRDSFSPSVVDGDQLNDGYFVGNFAPLLVGDGSDGAFSATSGNTALTQGTVYQYTSFNLTSTATISTTKTTGEPVIVLVQGDLTISGSGTCDFSGCGEDSPYATTENCGTGNAVLITFTTHSNGGTGTYNATQANSVGVGGNPPAVVDLMRIYNNLGIFNHTPLIISGTKGGNGGESDTANTVGTGGSGGGSIIFIVGGTATISGKTFDMTGDAGTNGSATAGNSVAQGGGGGGGGSIGIFCYGTLTDSGTYTITGGAGGTGAENGTYSGNYVGAGGGGASTVGSGSNGDSSRTDAATGGAGADGIALREQIYW